MKKLATALSALSAWTPSPAQVVNIGRTAAELVRHHTAPQPKLFTEPFLNASIEDAWAAQHAYAKLRLDHGESLIGFKVGCTSAQTQAQLGIEHPVYGHLFASHRRYSPQDVALADFDGLAVEGELAVELNCELQDLQHSNRALQQAIHRVFPVIELHHAGTGSNQVRTAPVLIGNNAIHAGFIQQNLGEEIEEQPISSLRIYFDSECVADIEKQALFDTIFNSLRWLSNKLRTHRQTIAVKPPVTVLCGTIAPLFRLNSATRVEVTTNARQIISCNLT